MLNGVKRALRKVIVCRRKHKLFSSIMKGSKALVKSHPEWVALTRAEKALMTDKDYCQYVAFKNIRGVLEYGHVSDALYQAYILPVLNPANYTELFRSTRKSNIFCNKNYFELMLKYFPMPKAVIRCINGVLMNADYRILMEEEALKEMNHHESLVFKPATGGYHGRNISCVERKDFRDALIKYVNYDNGGRFDCPNNFEAA